MKNLYLVANWKMNKTIAETNAFFDEFLLENIKTKNHIVICPSYLSIPKAVEKTAGTNIEIGAQNMHYANSGVWTGEVSAKMLTEVGAKYVIIGHSSRRAEDNETNEKINLKLKAALKNGLTPILCIGESAKEREAGRTYRVLKKQILWNFNEIEDPEKVIIAYEPLWAISDGKNLQVVPTVEEIRAVNSGIKRVLRQIYTPEQVKKINILYGGSVSDKNAREIMQERSVNGVLVGGASLNPQKFKNIIKAVN